MTRQPAYGSVSARTLLSGETIPDFEAKPAKPTTNTTFALLPVVWPTPRKPAGFCRLFIPDYQYYRYYKNRIYTHTRARARAARLVLVVSVVLVVRNVYIYIYQYLIGKREDYKRTTKSRACSPFSGRRTLGRRHCAGWRPRPAGRPAPAASAAELAPAARSGGHAAAAAATPGRSGATATGQAAAGHARRLLCHRQQLGGPELAAVAWAPADGSAELAPAARSGGHAAAAAATLAQPGRSGATATGQAAAGHARRLLCHRQQLGGPELAAVAWAPADGSGGVGGRPIGAAAALESLGDFRCAPGGTHKRRGTPRARPIASLHNAPYAALTGYRRRPPRPAWWPRRPATGAPGRPRGPPGRRPRRGTLAHDKRPGAGQKFRKIPGTARAGRGWPGRIAAGGPHGEV